MEQKEFNKYQKINESNLYDTYNFDDCIFIIEPNYYGQLKYLEKRYVDDYEKIINKMIEEVIKNKKVIFTGDYENPVCNKEDFIYIEVEDILNKLNIFTGYISNGSDYGD